MEEYHNHNQNQNHMLQKTQSEPKSNIFQVKTLKDFKEMSKQMNDFEIEFHRLSHSKSHNAKEGQLLRQTKNLAPKFDTTNYGYNYTQVDIVAMLCQGNVAFMMPQLFGIIVSYILFDVSHCGINLNNPIKLRGNPMKHPDSRLSSCYWAYFPHIIPNDMRTKIMTPSCESRTKIMTPCCESWTCHLCFLSEVQQPIDFDLDQQKRSGRLIFEIKRDHLNGIISSQYNDDHPFEDLKCEDCRRTLH